MRNLPTKLNPKQALIVEATKDYFGTGAPVKGLQRNIINVSLWLMKKRKNINLNDEEKSAIWAITENLSDKVYFNSLNLSFNSDSSEGIKK
jgi:hypothetical protein